MAKALKTRDVGGNLLHRKFETYSSWMILLTEITYLPYTGTFAYLSAILDAFTNKYSLICSVHSFKWILCSMQ